MKKKIDKDIFLMIIGIIGFLPFAIYTTYLAFKYPDITRVRFMLIYWKQELIMLIFISLFAIGYIHNAYTLGKNE